MAPTYYGTTAAIAQGTAIEWDLTNGETEILEWRGVTTSVKAIYDSAVTTEIYDSMQYDPKKGIATLRARVVLSGPTTTGGDSSATVYELYEMPVMRPIEDALVFVQNLTPEDVARLKFCFAKGNSLDQAAVVAGSYEEDFYNLLLKGTTEFFDSTYILRRTYRGASRNSYFTAAYDGCNTATSGAQPPTSVGSVIGSVPKCNWLKKAPRVQRTGIIWEISQEWWGIRTTTAGSTAVVSGAGWSEVLYGGDGLP